MIKTASTALFCLLLYGLLIIPFTSYLHNKPVVEKMGYVPSVAALKSIAADHKELVAASLVLKVLMYFGGISEKAESQVVVPPDFMSMSRLLHGAVKLDPYNMDAYYFAQGFLTWDVKQYQLANNLLDFGMKYRTWDWYLPFFAGFNSAYFLKDFAAAAKYYQRAGDLSGSDMSKLLAGRYMQESGQTDLAIAYLTAMEKGENNPALKKNYHLRLTAFKEVRRIELARDHYAKAGGTLPTTVDALIRSGLLSPPPSDPYGGQFYLELDGKVTTTSKFAFAGGEKNDFKKGSGNIPGGIKKGN
jgi:tetratricopeptide (TPR) repeat protein